MLSFLLPFVAKFSINAMEQYKDYKLKQAETALGMEKEQRLREAERLQTEIALRVQAKELQIAEGNYWWKGIPKFISSIVVASYVAALGYNQGFGDLTQFTWTVHTVPLWDWIVYTVVAYWFLGSTVKRFFK